MYNQCFKVNYIGKEKITGEDIKNALADFGLMVWGMWEIETEKTHKFLIHYLGSEKTYISEIKQALIEANLDEEGVLKVKSEKPKYKQCKACRGIGNIDEAMGFACDCGVCGGSGWVRE